VFTNTILNIVCKRYCNTWTTEMDERPSRRMTKGVFGNNFGNLILQKSLFSIKKLIRLCFPRGFAFFSDEFINTIYIQNKTIKHKTLTGAGNWTRDLLHARRIHALPLHNRVTYVTDCCLLSFLTNKQIRICGPYILNKWYFSALRLHA